MPDEEIKKPVEEVTKDKVEEPAKGGSASGGKKGLFSFLKREKKTKVENPEDVKKVVTKEKFLEDFKDGELEGKKNHKKTVKKEKKGKPVETKAEEKPKDKK